MQDRGFRVCGDGFSFVLACVLQGFGLRLRVCVQGSGFRA